MAVDLNADVGEGMDDRALLPYLTSANVACGLHAGDPTVMDTTVAEALECGVCVGAHPGYADRENFGRVRMEMSPEAVERLVLYQIAALEGFVRSRGGALTHVKPHGALYHAGAKSPEVARAIARGVRRARPDLVVVGQPGSRLLDADPGTLPAGRGRCRAARDIFEPASEGSGMREGESGPDEIERETWSRRLH